MFYLDKIPPTAANLNNSRVVKREKKSRPCAGGKNSPFIRNRARLGLRQLFAENQEIEERDENCAARSVAYRDEEKILREGRGGERRERAAVQHEAERDEEHVGHAVLEAHRDEPDG